MVREIAKEKTARIIPNAVGVYTTDEKHHTFGSLMSREATYTHMLQTKKRFDLNEEEMLADDKDETEVRKFFIIIIFIINNCHHRETRRLKIKFPIQSKAVRIAVTILRHWRKEELPELYQL